MVILILTTFHLFNYYIHITLEFLKQIFLFVVILKK